MNKAHQTAEEEIPNKLPEQEHNTIFKKLEGKLLYVSEPNLNPRVVIVGGQAGAGKTSIKQYLSETVFANRTPAIIDSDSYRDEHPNFAKIIKTDEKKLYEKTNDDVREWTSKLLSSGLQNNRDIVLEATMRNTVKTLNTIKKIKEEHPQYKIHIVCLSVNSEVSRTGMMNRYFGQKESKGYGRFVSVESHDKTCKNLPETLRAVEEQGLIDSVVLVDRQNKEIYRHEAVDGVYTKPPRCKDAGSNYARHQSRNGFTKEDRKAQHDMLAQRMQKLGADKKEIADMIAMVMGIKKEKAENER